MLHADFATFAHEIDHILPRKHGGGDSTANLAYACAQCNRYKGSDFAAIEPETDEIVSLFNPRTALWAEHTCVHNLVHILILGAGGQGQVLADAMRFAAEAGQPVTPLGYLDDNPSLWQRAPLGLPMLGALAAWRDIAHDALLLGIGANRRRCELYTTLTAEGAHFAAFCHPTALVGHDVVVGPATAQM